MYTTKIHACIFSDCWMISDQQHCPFSQKCCKNDQREKSFYDLENKCSYKKDISEIKMKENTDLWSVIQYLSSLVWNGRHILPIHNVCP